MGGRLRNRCEDHLSDTIDIVDHVTVPEPHHDPPTGFEIFCASLILVDLRRMMATVQLDREPRGTASDIDDDISDHQLPGKARSIGAKCVPKQALGWGRAAP